MMNIRTRQNDIWAKYYKEFALATYYIRTRLRHPTFQRIFVRAEESRGQTSADSHQAKLVAWHLTTRVPLHFAAIPEADIVTACERFGMSLERWRRQESAVLFAKEGLCKTSGDPRSTAACADRSAGIGAVKKDDRLSG